MKIKYVNGDATQPKVKEGHIGLICHVVNDIGVWGAGFVIAINHQFGLRPQEHYKNWYKRKFYRANVGDNIEDIPFVLGQVQVVDIHPSLCVVNLLAQRGVGGMNECGVNLDIPNVNYSSLHESFHRLMARITHLYKWPQKEVELHMPRIGAGLGGGEWIKIEKVIDSVFKETPVEVTVYDFVGEK